MSIKSKNSSIEKNELNKDSSDRGSISDNFFSKEDINNNILGNLPGSNKSLNKKKN